jgi:hypothetical protein
MLGVRIRSELRWDAACRVGPPRRGFRKIDARNSSHWQEVVVDAVRCIGALVSICNVL